MLKFTTTGDVLKSLLKYMDICNNNTKLEYNDKELTFTSIDPSSTCMLVGKVNPKVAFTSYEADESYAIIDVKLFETVLKRLKKNTATFELRDDGKIIVKEGNTTWNVNTISEDGKYPKPQISTNNIVTIPSSKFVEEVSRAMDGGEILDFEISEDAFTLSGRDEYSTPIVTKIPKNELTNIEFSEKSKSSYAKSFIEDLIKCLPGDISLKIGVDNQYPLCVNMVTSNDAYDINYYLAPRIEEE